MAVSNQINTSPAKNLIYNFNSPFSKIMCVYKLDFSWPFSNKTFTSIWVLFLFLFLCGLSNSQIYLYSFTLLATCCNLTLLPLFSSVFQTKTIKRKCPAQARVLDGRLFLLGTFLMTRLLIWSPSYSNSSLRFAMPVPPPGYIFFTSQFLYTFHFYFTNLTLQ